MEMNHLHIPHNFHLGTVKLLWEPNSSRLLQGACVLLVVPGCGGFQVPSGVDVGAQGYRSLFNILLYASGSY